jgi:sulfoxide reductase catalytic subunit YedY
MLIRMLRRGDPAPSEITPESVWLSRRALLAGLTGLAVGAALPAPLLAAPGVAGLVAAPPEDPRAPAWLRRQVAGRAPSAVGGGSAGEALTPWADVSGYNNFYEFGTGKGDPARLGSDFLPHPWRVRIDGHVGKPGDYTLEDILGGQPLEERIHRLRCVEAWSMVIPWTGFPLAALLRRVEPGSRARYVVFQTLHDPERLPGQRGISWLSWPYVEGLRIDEAMHPLTLLAAGVYGRTLPAQNGAPLRLVVPWKYGFKSIKSIVRISLVEEQPATTWAKSAPREYGFYANVNPAVDHPRWSQARERRLPNTLFSPNWMPTRPFNGYADEVAGLYRGMDLRRFF